MRFVVALGRNALLSRDMEVPRGHRREAVRAVSGVLPPVALVDSGASSGALGVLAGSQGGTLP
jgi:carbamate kinase